MTFKGQLPGPFGHYFFGDGTGQPLFAQCEKQLFERFLVGLLVEPLLLGLLGILVLLPFVFSVFCFLSLLLLLQMAAAQNVLVARLVLLPGTTLRLAPWADRVTTPFGSTFTTTVRMIDRVHGHATYRRTHTSPATCAGLAELAEIVFAMTDFADCGTTVNMNPAHFARPKSQRCVSAFACGELRRTAGRANHLSTLARLHFDVVHDRTDRHALERHRVSGLDIGLRAGDDLVTDGEPLGWTRPCISYSVDERDLEPQLAEDLHEADLVLPGLDGLGVSDVERMLESGRDGQG